MTNALLRLVERFGRAVESCGRRIADRAEFQRLMREGPVMEIDPWPGWDDGVSTWSAFDRRGMDESIAQATERDWDGVFLFDEGPRR